MKNKLLTTITCYFLLISIFNISNYLSINANAERSSSVSLVTSFDSEKTGDEKGFGDFCYVDFWESDSHEIKITQYYGYDSHVTVPDKIEGKPVTMISNSLFENNTDLISIELPDTLKSIPSFAFGGCSSLKTVSIPRDVKKIDSLAFCMCSSLQDVKFNSISNLEYIGAAAFQGCSSLKSIKIPDSVKVINGHVGAFYDCTALESINIPKGLIIIDKESFEGCKSLKEITIPNNITTLEERCFSRCDSLVSLTIPASVTKIDRNILGNSYNNKLVIYCESGSRAEQFANAKGIKTAPIGSAPIMQNLFFGDLDDDNIVTSADALIVLRVSVGLEPINDNYFDVADVDKDGNITSADSLVILRYSVGFKDKGTVFYQ